MWMNVTLTSMPDTPPDGSSGGAPVLTPAPGIAIGSRVALWIPGLPLAVSIVTLFYCLFLFDGWQKLFRDSDTGWHIRIGEAILRMHTLPATDPYSFTRTGERWLDWEWASDVCAAAAHGFAGPAGVAAFFACVIAFCTWLWFRLHFAVGGDLLLASLMAAPMLSTVNLHWLARPHVFGWAMLLIAMLMLERARAGRLNLVWFVALGAAWANLHASFFLGPIVALLYAAGAFLKPLIWDSVPSRSGRPALIAAAAMSLGTVCNPYGIALHIHVFQYLANTELLDRIGEFQTFNFHVPGAAQILIMLGIACAGAAAALSARRPEHFLTAAFFLIIGLRSARGLPIVALAVLPLANGAITDVFHRAGGLNQALRRRFDAALDYSSRLRAIDAQLSGVALVPFILLMLFVIARSPAIAARSGFPADEFPVAASSAVAGLPASARILAPDKFGGYLIYRFNGSRKVFFDGRSDFYGAAFMKDYIRLVEVRPGWREQLTAFHFTHALLPNNYSLIPALEQSGWRTTYKDTTATLLAAPGN